MWLQFNAFLSYYAKVLTIGGSGAKNIICSSFSNLLSSLSYERLILSVSESVAIKFLRLTKSIFITILGACVRVIALPSFILTLMCREVLVAAYRLFVSWCFVLCLSAATCVFSFGNSLCTSLMHAYGRELD
ncbi:MAG: hypothetical protein ACTS40_02210 [Candidatus Hodgkinia cicadicola]